MKNIIIITIVSCLMLFGCKSKPENSSYYNNTTNTIMQTQFNEEHYVWEGFIFSTNRVDKIN